MFTISYIAISRSKPTKSQKELLPIRQLLQAIIEIDGETTDNIINLKKSDVAEQIKNYKRRCGDLHENIDPNYGSLSFERKCKLEWKSIGLVN